MQEQDDNFKILMHKFAEEFARGGTVEIDYGPNHWKIRFQGLDVEFFHFTGESMSSTYSLNNKQIDGETGYLIRSFIDDLLKSRTPSIFKEIVEGLDKE